MAVKQGRLEAQMTFAANKAGTWTDNIGATVVTITAGSYYLAELVTEINTQLPRSWLVSISDGEGTPTAATGLATISSADYNISVTWTDTEIRDALGFTGNISGASTAQTGTRQCPGLWLPGNPGKFTRHGDSEAGTLNTSFRQTVGPTGTVFSFGGGTGYFREINGILWDGVPGRRVRPHLATYTNETLEEFIGNSQYLTGTYANLFATGASIRIYWDADVDGTYKAGKFLFPPTFDPDTFFAGSTSYYRVPMPAFIVGA